MEEKTIIQSMQFNVRRLRNILFAIGILICLALSSVGLVMAHGDWERNTGPNTKWPGYIGMSFGKYVTGGFVDSYVWYYIWAGVFLLIIFVGLGCFYYALLSKTTITVTDKRVYGCASFGRRVDLPLDSISAVGTSPLKGISISTPSGGIKFNGILNRNDIHSAISKMLVERQNKPLTQTTIRQEVAQSNADELAKFRELLDKGIITKEEFDAKKKQLLGL